MRAIALAVFAGMALGAGGGEIVLPPGGLERDAPVRAIYRVGRPVSGKGRLSIEWSDAHGRLVERREIPVELSGQQEIDFSLDLRRAAAIENEVRARLAINGREEEARAAFIARPAAHSWRDYEILMWQPGSAAAFGALRGLGVSGGVVFGNDRARPAFLLDNDMRWYVENIATDFFSPYHHYYPDHRPNGWAFEEAKRLYRRDPAAAFERHPSLSDPAWLEKIRQRLVETARYFAPYRPVFYSLGDETGIAELAAFWDFDFSKESLAAFRKWAAQRYGSLEALNREWGSAFRSWDAVMPMTTDEAIKRGDDNFSAWADFKEFMDAAYAGALKMGAEAIRSVDPEAYVAIGGAQMPGWGGYDYSRIAGALTAIEPYDIGNNIEIIASLNPEMAVMTTSYARGAEEKRRVWHELLAGNRGLILWDEKGEFAGQRGVEAAPYFREIREGLGALLMASRREPARIAIHYSQPSMRTEWMLEQRPKGGAWVERTSSVEASDSRFLKVRESWRRFLEDEGLAYRFVSYGQVERGEVRRGGYRVLILPRSSAMSQAEAKAVREFVAAGGVVIADGEPATFDEHGRRLRTPQLADLFREPGRAVRANADRSAGGLIRGAGVVPEFTLTDESGQRPAAVETHLWRNGTATIVALLSSEAPDSARARVVKLRLPGESYVYDVRGARALGRRSEIAVRLDPYEPAIYAVSGQPLAALRVSAPQRLARGETGLVRCGFDRTAGAETSVLHLDVVAPDGKPVAYYSGNLWTASGSAVWRVPLALNDQTGKWSVRVRDVLSGQTATATIEVH